MDLHPKRLASRVMTSLPVHRVLPPGAIRTYAALRYLAERGDQDEVSAYLRRNGAPSSRFAATAVVAATGALRTGQDDVLARILDDAEGRFPDTAELRRLRAVWLGFLGEHERALEVARTARMLAPASVPAAVEEVRLSYRAVDEAEADDAAVRALARFPDSAALLWAVAKECRTAEQYERLVDVWRVRAQDPSNTPVAVRQLSTAAGRAGCTEEAIAWYHQAFARLLQAGTAPAIPPPVRLHGKGAWTAIEDVAALFDAERVPYFFAAGTVLGFVREGRPLSLDGDIDVGIRDEHFDLETLTDIFRRHPRFEFDVVHPRTKKLGLRHRGGSPVDLFRFYEEDGRLYHDGVFVRWHNSPFGVQRFTVQGLELPIPEDEERYLTENYGDWRVPNADFDAFTDDAPNVEVTWPEYRRLHHIRRAYRAFLEGDRAGAAGFLRTADEDDLATRIEHVDG